MSQKQYQIMLTQPEIDHIGACLDDRTRTGEYYGPCEQFWKRHQRILDKLAEALKNKKILDKKREGK